MSLIPGRYQHYKNENTEDYLYAVGVPFLARKMLAVSSPLIEIQLEGDKMKVSNRTMMFHLQSTFTVGEEYDEKMPRHTLKSKTTIINDHEMETVSINPDDGSKNTRRYLFTEDECVITMTHEKVTIAGKRYFRRLK